MTVSRLTDADFDLVDTKGCVLRSYTQTVTYEPNEDAYLAACNPPMDEETRKFNGYPAAVERADDGRDAQISETWKPPVYVPRSSPVSFPGKSLDVSYKTGNRPRGNVAVW